MSKDDSGIGRRPRRGEFSQVVSPDAAPNRRRRNSMPLPAAHGGRVLPMVRQYQPPAEHGGQEYWYHVTTPQNFGLIRQAGGLMPLSLQPQRGQGLDQETGRDNPASWSDQLRQGARAIQDATLDARMHNLMGVGSPIDPQELTRPLREDLAQLAHEGANQENLYMSAGIGSSLDYMMGSRGMQRDGAVLMRVPRQGTGGFNQDTQGKRLDYRSLGRVIPNRHIEFAEIAPDRVVDVASMEDRDALGALSWQPAGQGKAQPVRFAWQSGGCSPDTRSQHGFGGPKRDPGGGSRGGGTIV